MELILISYPDDFKSETSIVCKLLENYDFIFHLRKPNYSVNDYVRYLESIPKALHQKIVVHNALEALVTYAVKGVHFSSRNRPKEVTKSTRTYSTSCHSLDEVKRLEGKYDYVFLSPIYPSISKEGYSANYDLKEVREYLSSKRKTKVIALGGIDESKINKVHAYSFDGVAVLGAVWSNNPSINNQIEYNFKKIYRCLKKDPIV